MIPKVIHYCWLSGDPYPESIQKCIDSWKKILPDYEIKVWSKETFNIDSVLWVKEAFTAKKYAFAADYIRFWALYHYGGIYLDSDVEVLKTFDECLSVRSFIGFEYLNIPEAAVIGAEKGCVWIKECLGYYQDKSFYDIGGQPRMDVVPYLVKLSLEKIYGMKVWDIDKIQEFPDITLYPYYYFSPKNYFTSQIMLNPKTIAIHRFASAWGPTAKRQWGLIIHSLMIRLLGKAIHDRIYRTVKPFPRAFNGDVL